MADAPPSRPFDVILVLGARVRADGGPGPSVRRRVAHAVREFRRGAAPRLLMSGGSFEGLPAESHVMRDLAVDAGVPGDRILVEERSRNTLENMAFSLPILERNDWRRVLVVTDGFHMPRSLLILRRLGIDATGSRASGAPAWYRLLAGGREAVMYLRQWARPVAVGGGRELS